MKAGEVFDPVEVTRRLKAYPVDVVDALPDLSDGPKRLYSQIFRLAVTSDRRKNPWQGFVYASEKFLAARLGKSESAIRRDSAVLRARELVKVERPRHQGSNHYFFLWQPEFHRSDVSVAEAHDEQEHRSDSSVEHRADSSVGIPLHRSDVSVAHRSDVSVAYKEEQILRANTHTPATVSESGFLEFQAAYPEAKQQIKVDSSCQAYLSVIDGKPGEHERLMAGLARYKASAEWQRRLSQNGGECFIPSMERFISERLHRDHPPPAKARPMTAAIEYPSAADYLRRIETE